MKDLVESLFGNEKVSQEEMDAAREAAYQEQAKLVEAMRRKG